MRRVPAVLAGLAVAAGVALYLMAIHEQPYRHYATFAEAVAAGERDRGWLPEWMPSDAVDLHMQGDVDTNAWWIRARIPASGVQSLRRIVVPVAVDSVRVRRPRRSGAWWMESLIEQHPANDNGLHADLFRGAGDPVPRTTVVAFDRASDAVYIWTSGISIGAPAPETSSGRRVPRAGRFASIRLRSPPDGFRGAPGRAFSRSIGLSPDPPFLPAPGPRRLRC